MSELIKTLCDADLREMLIKAKVISPIERVTIGDLELLYDTMYRKCDEDGMF